MGCKKFLVSVAAAVAALVANTSQAVTTPPVSATDSHALTSSTLAVKQSNDPIFQRVTYPIGTEKHELLMRVPASGVMYAQHSSHYSHGSHGSHRSHRSGY